MITVRCQPAECARCGRVSGPYWWRWRAYRLGAGEEPELAIYCQTCANRTFGLPRRRPLVERRRRTRA